MTEASKIREGQIWARKRDGVEFVVRRAPGGGVAAVAIQRLGEGPRGSWTTPWKSTFLRTYELVRDVS